jgi:hypothetical protein
MEAALSASQSKPIFRIHLNGVYIPNINIRRTPNGEGNELLVEDQEIGWIPLYDDDGTILEWRDETAWSLLPEELKRNSQDSGWNRCTPQELIGILWNTGVLE